jgi:hypothetical protein
MKIDEWVYKILPYDKSIHFIIGNVIWSACVMLGLSFMFASICGITIGALIEIIQRKYNIGEYSYMDMFYVALGASLPTLSIIIRNL